MTSTVPVVIVGAGPTGVTAATLLAQYGIECLVLDRWETVYPQPRAVHVDDEIYRVFARLGIAHKFAAISRPARGLRLLDPDMRVLAQFDRDGSHEIHGFPQANMFDQPDLEQLLRDNLMTYPSATLRGNVNVTDIAQDDRGRARVSYTDLTTGSEHLVDATYVLGCDGANSIVRNRMGAVMEDLHFEQRWLVIDIATDADLNQWEGAHQVCDPRRAATYMRIGDHRYRWEFRLLAHETAADYGSIADVAPLISPWTGNTAYDRLSLIRLAEYVFRAQLADRWRDRNVFLLGDAAHLTPPFIGQGMGAGLRDAVNLAWKLTGVLAGGLSDDVLNTYEAERKPHVRSLIRLALAVGWAMTAGGDMGNLIRRAVVPRLHLIPGMRSRLRHSATPPLRRGALVARPHRPGQLAGTLCPNTLMANGDRPDALLGNRFAFITAVDLTREQCHDLAQRGAAVVVAEPGCPLARWLGRVGALAAIVRPDRTVMCAGRVPSYLCEAMPRFAAALEHDAAEQRRR